MASAFKYTALLEGDLSEKNIRQLSVIFNAALCLMGAVSMTAIARMSGICYRTMGRFYQKELPWAKIRITWFAKCFHTKGHRYAIIGDETVRKTAGKKMFGLDYFYSSTAGKPIQGLSFMAFDIVDLNTGKNYPINVQQIVKTEADKAQAKLQQKGQNKKTKTKGNTDLQAETPYEYPLLRAVKEGFKCFLPMLFTAVPDLELQYLLLDGFFGHLTYVNFALANKLHIISKLKGNSALYLSAPKSTEKKRGRPKVYGEKVDLGVLYPEYIVKKHDSKFKQVQQFQVLSRKLKGHVLNVVVAYRDENDLSKREVYFSTDLNLSASDILSYYGFRTLIEITFRDCKQYFGLATFKSILESSITFSVELAFTLSSLCCLLRKDYQEELKVDFISVADVRALSRVERIVQNIIYAIPNLADNTFNAQQIRQFARGEAVNL